MCCCPYPSGPVTGPQPWWKRCTSGSPFFINTKKLLFNSAWATEHNGSGLLPIRLFTKHTGVQASASGDDLLGMPLTCFSLPPRELDHWGTGQLNSSTVDADATVCLRKPSTWGRTQEVWFFQRTANQSESFWERQYHLFQGPKQQLFNVRMQGDTDINRTWFHFIVVKRKKQQQQKNQCYFQNYFWTFHMYI